MQYLIAALIGLLGGVTSGMFGVGGGVVMVPAMMFFLGVNIKTAIGTSLMVIVPTAMMGTWKHHTQGNVEWKIGFALIPTAIIGGFIGAWLTKLIHADDLKRAFGGFLIAVGIKLLFFK
ncbi:MAG: sulfite exporter TauE/SafE family protein [Verrucomicrobiota bacterium]